MALHSDLSRIEGIQNANIGLAQGVLDALGYGNDEAPGEPVPPGIRGQVDIITAQADRLNNLLARISDYVKGESKEATALKASAGAWDNGVAYRNHGIEA